MRRAPQTAVARALYRLRTELFPGATQADIAERAGVATSYIANLECGRKTLSFAQARSLAEAIGTDEHTRQKSLHRLQRALVEDLAPELPAAILLEVMGENPEGPPQAATTRTWSGWARRVRELCASIPLSIPDELALAAGACPETVRAALDGRITPPRHLVEHIAQALGASVTEHLLLAAHIPDQFLWMRDGALQTCRLEHGLQQLAHGSPGQPPADSVGRAQALFPKMLPEHISRRLAQHDPALLDPDVLRRIARPRDLLRQVPRFGRAALGHVAQALEACGAVRDASAWIRGQRPPAPPSPPEAP